MQAGALEVPTANSDCVGSPYFGVTVSGKAVRCLQPNQDYVHIHSLEFIVMIVQLDAIIVRLESLSIE
jgi:hypothetical protein